MDDGVGDTLHIHSRLYPLRAIGLWYAIGHALCHGRCRIADIDLTAGDIVFPAIE